jgi:hypothetical protein
VKVDIVVLLGPRDQGVERACEDDGHIPGIVVENSHSAQPLIALVYLCCSGIVIDLPR